MNEHENDPFEFRPLVKAWRGRIQKGIEHRQEFMDVAEQCMNFFAGAMTFMWKEEYQRKHMGLKSGQLKTKFQICIAKAFELVALFGPVLYHRNPKRTVKPREQVKFGPEVFQALMGADPMMAQQAQQYFQMAQQAQGTKAAKDDVRAKLMESYLSYTPDEQPGGGLRRHASNGITEALVKGRGVLWPEKFVMPGSDRILTGCFHDRVENLVIDPDVKGNSLDDATWIARHCCHPRWQVEREYGLKDEALKAAATMESGNAQGDRAGDDLAKFHRERGDTFDLVHYWKIWSRGGIGRRLKDAEGKVNQYLDDIVGDYAYMVIAENVPYFLNAPPENVWQATTDSDVRRMFDWPTPFYLDRKWPCAVLDFYPHPDEIWPIAPLAPGLGELHFMNIFMARLAERAWTSAEEIYGIAAQSLKEAKQALRGSARVKVVPVQASQGSIKNMIDAFERPELKAEVFSIYSAIAENFDKRVGLTELWYSMNVGGAASRTAKDVAAKEEKASIRPDHMSREVHSWLAEASEMERQCAYWAGVEGRDIEPLLGQAGAFLWDQLVTSEEPEVVMRGMTATVVEESARRPNKERDQANLDIALRNFGPILDRREQATGNTGPINWILEKWGDSAGMDMTPAQIPPPPPPDPTQNPQFQLEQAKLQMKAQEGQQQLQLKRQEAQLEQRRKEQEHVQELTQDQEVHEQEMAQRRQENALDLETAMMQMRMSTAQTAAKIQAEKAKTEAKIKAQQAAARAKPAGAKK